MGQKETTNPIYVRYNGLFDLDSLYAAIVDWCKNYGFMWTEATYKHKVPNPYGAEQEWIWVADKKVNPYTKYTLVIFGHGWDLNDVEITKNNKKKVLSNGRLEIKMIGVMELDWQNKFAGSKWRKVMGKWYYSVMRRDIEGTYMDTMYYRMWNLQAVIKKHFDMQTKTHEYKDYLGES